MERVKVLALPTKREAIITLEEKYLNDEIDTLQAQMDSGHQERTVRRFGPFMITVQSRYA